MELWINVFILLFGVWNISMGMAMHTKNFQSALIFKIVPFFGGLGLLYVGVQNAGLI